MVLWHLKSRPQVKLTINRGQFVTSEMILWHSKVISASVDPVMKLVQLDKFKKLYILVFCAFFEDWCQMGYPSAFIRPGSL